MGRILAWLGRPALLRSLLLRLRLAGRLLRDPAVPAAVKGLVALPLVYLVWPIDLLPDLVPVLGQLDDLGVVVMAVEAFLALCPGHAVAHHRRAIEDRQAYSPLGGDPSPPPTSAAEGQVIDAEWRRADDRKSAEGNSRRPTRAGRQ
jgi:uncharacterized membrane protein YkvA (DUF1232 family)